MILWCGFLCVRVHFSFSVLSPLHVSFDSLALNIKSRQTSHVVNSAIAVFTWSD